MPCMSGERPRLGNTSAACESIKTEFSCKTNIILSIRFTFECLYAKDDVKLPDPVMVIRYGKLVIPDYRGAARRVCMPCAWLSDALGLAAKRHF